MQNKVVLIQCLDCNMFGTNIGDNMQCGNCQSYNTRRFIETDPAMDDVAWNIFGYAWARWRGIDWYHAMDDIRLNREKHGTAGTLQIYVEGVARAHLTKHAPDLGWVCGKCKTVNDEERSLCGFCDTPRLSG